MQNDIDNQDRVYKHATVLKYENGIAKVRIHTDSSRCRGCGNNKKSGCALYTFGSIFSRHRDIWQLPSKRALTPGEQIKLIAPSNVLVKIAASCYGLPIAALIGSTTLAHMLLGTEWLTLLVGSASLVVSYVFVKRWLCSIRIPDIQIKQ